MKKSFALFIALMLLAVTVVCYGQVSIYKERDQVQFVENVLYGDKSVVDGVTVKVKNTYDNYLYWDTTYVIGEEPKISTDYSFYQWRQGEHEYSYGGDLFFYQDYIRLLDWEDENIPYPSEGLQLAMHELYEDTGASERGEKTIFVKDYLDYYHFALDISTPHNSSMDTPSFHLSLVEEELENDIAYGEERGIAKEEVDKVRKHLEWLHTFQNYFKIPILENEVTNIAMEKDEDGNVIGWGNSSVGGGSGTGDMEMPEFPDPEKYDSFDFDIRYLIEDGDVYFTFDTHSFMGAVVDTSLIPGGYGIYHFPYDIEKEEIYPEQLQMVYALDPNTRVYDLAKDARGENLLLFTIEEEDIYMSVIDIDTMQFVDKFQVSTEEYGIDHYKLDEDYMVINGEELVVLTIDEKGIYHKAFAVSKEQIESLNRDDTGMTQIPSADTVYNWDGENLLFANYFYNQDGYMSCNFYVVMMNNSGLQYFATYDSSLRSTLSKDTQGYDTYKYIMHCRPAYFEPITIQW